jgi:hypothetical protein
VRVFPSVFFASFQIQKVPLNGAVFTLDSATRELYFDLNCDRSLEIPGSWASQSMNSMLKHFAVIAAHPKGVKLGTATCF